MEVCRQTRSAEIQASETDGKGHGVGVLGFGSVVYQEYLLPGVTINSAQYFYTMMRLQQAFKAKRPGLLSWGVVLLHDNARVHTASITQSFLKVLLWDVFGQPSVLAGLGTLRLSSVRDTEDITRRTMFHHEH